MDMIMALTSKNDKYACALADKIIAESQETDEWYAYFDDFAALLKHPKSLVRNRALHLVAANVEWDDENRFDAVITEYLSHITDEKPITARQCIKALAKIGQTKQEYIPRILSALHSADLSKYKDSMRPLIEKDMAETERILTNWNLRGEMKMAFDFKKEYKEFYMPKDKPQIVDVPKTNYIAVRGKGNPNEEGGAYQQAVSVLYAIAYTLKMSYKGEHKIEGFFEYVVPPLEGFWWQDGIDGVNYADKSTFNWISVIRLPDFVTKKDFLWAVETAEKKKKLDCSSAEFFTVTEGLCVQIMHIGPFDDEPKSVAQMDTFLEQNGYENDMNETRLHHEIYMSDARKVAPEKWKTVIRHPIKKK